MITHHNQKQLEKERDHLAYKLSPITERSQGQSSRQELNDRPWRNEAHWLAQLPFLNSSTHSLGMAPPTVGWGLLYQLTMKKVLHRHAHKTVKWREFFNWESLFPSVSRFVSSRQKLTSTAVTYFFLNCSFHFCILAPDIPTGVDISIRYKVWIQPNHCFKLSWELCFVFSKESFITFL